MTSRTPRRPRATCASRPAAPCSSGAQPDWRAARWRRPSSAASKTRSRACSTGSRPSPTAARARSRPPRSLPTGAASGKPLPSAGVRRRRGASTPPTPRRWPTCPRASPAPSRMLARPVLGSARGLARRRSRPSHGRGLARVLQGPHRAGGGGRPRSADWPTKPSGASSPEPPSPSRANVGPRTSRESCPEQTEESVPRLDDRARGASSADLDALEPICARRSQAREGTSRSAGASAPPRPRP